MYVVRMYVYYDKIWANRNHRKNRVPMSLRRSDLHICIVVHIRRSNIIGDDYVQHKSIYERSLCARLGARFCTRDLRKAGCNAPRRDQKGADRACADRRTLTTRSLIKLVN